MNDGYCKVILKEYSYDILKFHCWAEQESPWKDNSSCLSPVLNTFSVSLKLHRTLSCLIFQRHLSVQEAESLLPAEGVVFGRISLLYDQGCLLLDLSLTRLVTFSYLLLPPHLQCVCLCLMARRSALHSD